MFLSLKIKRNEPLNVSTYESENTSFKRPLRIVAYVFGNIIYLKAIKLQTDMSISVQIFWRNAKGSLAS